MGRAWRLVAEWNRAPETALGSLLATLIAGGYAYGVWLLVHRRLEARAVVGAPRLAMILLLAAALPAAHDLERDMDPLVVQVWIVSLTHAVAGARLLGAGMDAYFLPDRKSLPKQRGFRIEAGRTSAMNDDSGWAPLPARGAVSGVLLAALALLFALSGGYSFVSCVFDDAAPAGTAFGSPFVVVVFGGGCGLAGGLLSNRESKGRVLAGAMCLSLVVSLVVTSRIVGSLPMGRLERERDLASILVGGGLAVLVNALALGCLFGRSMDRYFFPPRAQSAEIRGKQSVAPRPMRH